MRSRNAYREIEPTTPAVALHLEIRDVGKMPAQFARAMRSATASSEMMLPCPSRSITCPAMPSSICVEANLRSVLPLDAEIHQTKIAVRHDARWRQARRRKARPHRAGAPARARPQGQPGPQTRRQAQETA